MSAPTASPLTPLEIASGLVFGSDPEAPGAEASPAQNPVGALEAAILPALERPPCVVSFSGGRDSSAVLAVATRLARREGLPLPIPGTNRFRRAPRAAEADWQERVVAFLELPDWHVLELDDELDAVGPYAARVLRRHGLLWPFNVHFHAPLLDAASGGSLLTGIGGDEVFATSRWARANDVLARRVRPVPRDALRVGFALLPPVLRRARLRRSGAASLRWLRSAANQALNSAWAAQAAAEPRRYEARIRWWRSLRPTRVGFASLDLLAADADAILSHPLTDPSFGDALARAFPVAIEREPALRAVFGDLLPADVYERPTKALFDEAFWGSHARAVAARWDGEGADPALVDPDALRQEWSIPVPDPHSLTLLQAAWLELDAA